MMYAGMNYRTSATAVQLYNYNYTPTSIYNQHTISIQLSTNQQSINASIDLRLDK